MTDPRTQATRTSMGVATLAPGTGLVRPERLGVLRLDHHVRRRDVQHDLGPRRHLQGRGARSGGIIVWDVSSWGWIHFILGIVLILTGLGLWAGQEWARWAGLSS